MTKQPELRVRSCACASCEAGIDHDLVQQHQHMNLFLSRLNEAQRRWYVGMVSQQPDSPGDVDLARITGLDRKTIRRGRRELLAGLADLPPERQRQSGGGRPASEKKMPT